MIQLFYRLCQLIVTLQTYVLIVMSDELFGIEFAHLWRFIFMSTLSLLLLTVRPIKFKSINQYNLFNIITYCIVGTYYKSILMCSVGVFFFIQFIVFAYGKEYQDNYHINATNGILNCPGLILLVNKHKIIHMAVVSGIVGCFGAF